MRARQYNAELPNEAERGEKPKLTQESALLISIELSLRLMRARFRRIFDAENAIGAVIRWRDAHRN